MDVKRGLAIPMLTLMASAAFTGTAGMASADGGDFSLDFVAAEPTSYDHQTGAGGEFGDRTINEDVVESLEGGDFSCGDTVVFFTQIVVAEDATETQDIQLDFSFDAESTGQPGIGFVDLLSATPNEGDSGNVGSTDDTTVQVISEELTADELLVTVQINDLDPGETFILRLEVELGCTADATPTGNLLAQLDDARVVSPVPDQITAGSGNQSVPLKNVQNVALEPATFTVDVGACPAPGSPTVPVTITINPPDSAVVTISGPGGPYVVDGAGAVLDLEPGDYTAVAVPAEGFFIEVDTIQFTVQDCPEIPAVVTVDVGACPAPGSPTVPVTITIDPADSAVVTITGPGGPYVVDGDGAVLDLEPGDYTAVAVPADGFSLEIDTIDFTVQDCPADLEPVEVTVDVGACPAPGSPTVPVTITIDPTDAAVVTITGPGGPYVVDGDGAVLDLPPGDYTADVAVAEGFFIEDDSIDFTVQDCPAVPASVEVNVGACPAGSSATRPVTVTIDPAGAAEVTISGPNGYNEVVTGNGATGNLAPGTYTYTATASPGFELTEPTEGTFTVGSCELAVTGVNTAGLVGIGLAFLSMGVGISRLARRTSLG